MKRSDLFNAIEQKLSLLSFRIEIRGRLNILDLNLHSENFYLHFLNILFRWELINLNAVHQNVPGIDLVDNNNKIIVQVSSVATEQKINSALKKNLSKYKDYNFKFICISKDASKLKTKTYSNPHNLKFSPNNDIYDVTSLLKHIASMNIDRQNEVFEFLNKELRSEPDLEKVETNLATIMKILSKVDWNQETQCFETVPYEIESKISYNQLDTARILIDDYKIHYHRIDKIYSDFDIQGANKSLSILNGIRTVYATLGSVGTPDQCFFMVIAKIAQKIQESANYMPIPLEELELCVQILVVDAFIRCKIFENPQGNSDAHS